MKDIGNSDRQEIGRRLNNRAENSHQPFRRRERAMQRFAKTIRQDLEAVRNGVSEPWSNGQTEGQINKLKTLKRAMYGRAGVDLLRARMMPL